MTCFARVDGATFDDAAAIDFQRSVGRVALDAPRREHVQPLARNHRAFDTPRHRHRVGADIALYLAADAHDDGSARLNAAFEATVDL